jgi:DNA-binding NtrC family response regulator
VAPIMTADASVSRDYARLFEAMNAALRVLLGGGDEEDALLRSFESAARGFGAEKALLLRVEHGEPLRLRRIAVLGLSETQVQACERGESVPGVSSSVVRAVVRTRAPKLIENPYLRPPDMDETPALFGQNFAVLCSPVLDPLRDSVLAVMYFQRPGARPEDAYTRDDLVWLEGYATTLGQAFGLYVHEQSREREMEELLQGQRRPEDAPELVGDSAHSQALRRLLHETYIPATQAPDPDPILILGEKGTGKDLVARYLYAYSARRSKPFLAVNCAEITDELAASRFFGHKRGSFTGAITDEPGLFRAADGGVLFLDEIAELSPRSQGTLLRVLENRTVVRVGDTRETHVDVQVVLATNRDLEAAVRDGSIKADFLDRFKTQAIRLEPLRARPWDIPALLQHFLSHHERRMRKKTLGFDPEALRALSSYSWPGNVRELARVCSLLVMHARPMARIDQALLSRCYPDAVTTARNPHAGPLIFEDVPMREALRAFKRELILSRLERHDWDLRATRESLGLPKTTLRRYTERLGLKRPKRRPTPENEPDPH